MKRQSVLVLAMIVSVVVGIWECVFAIIFGSLGLSFANWRLRRIKRCNKSAYMGNPSL